jgi:hypothetical protein
VEDEWQGLSIGDFSAAFDADLSDLIFIEIEDLSDGQVKQETSPNSGLFLAPEYNRLMVSRDATTGSFGFDRKVRYYPAENSSIDVSLKYRFFDGLAYSAPSILSIALAAVADTVVLDNVKAPNSLEIGDSTSMIITAIDSDQSENLLFEVTLSQGALQETITYTSSNDILGKFEIDLSELAQLLSAEQTFKYNETVGVSVRARSEDGLSMTAWSEPYTARIVPIPDLAQMVAIDSSNRYTIFGSNDFAGKASEKDSSFIAPDYEYVTSTNLNFDGTLLNDALKNIFGTDGRDFIYAPDALGGSTVGSILFGSGGDDFVYGGTGNDMLIASQGFDKLRGGQGDDLFIISNDIDYDSYSKSQMDSLLSSVIEGDSTSVTNEIFQELQLSSGQNLEIAGYIDDLSSVDRLQFNGWDWDSTALNFKALSGGKYAFVYAEEANDSYTGAVINLAFAQGQELGWEQTDFVIRQTESQI